MRAPARCLCAVAAEIARVLLVLPSALDQSSSRSKLVRAVDDVAILEAKSAAPARLSKELPSSRYQGVLPLVAVLEAAATGWRSNHTHGTRPLLPSSYGIRAGGCHVEARITHATRRDAADGASFIKDESLRDYFSQFGEVVECTVMRDSSTGRSRGFGFLTFKDAKTVNIVMVKEHFLDGKIIDPKRAIPRDEQEKTSKIFVGGVSQETTDQEFRDYFAQFGRVVDATLMMDKDTGRPRGFGFVTFESEAGVDACINVPLEIHGKPVEVKKAQPRGNLREEEEAAKRNKFRKDEQSGQGGMGGGQQMGGATNGMTPQLMAQYFQRMQQYFNMMQSQMAMNRGMQMNPAMWQQMMQMQQMQQQMMAGRGGGPGGAGNNPQNMMGGGNMNPQMMQQMQQQMMQMQQQQQQQQQGGQQQQPQGGDQGNYGGGFQQAPPQGPGGGRRGGRGGGYGGGGGGGGYGMGGGGGAPTSWEGMYDDVPQPGAGQGGFRRGGSGSQGTPDPQNAPPANAPTGPKNAGRPGANYRGGGRGGNRGFHPYAR
ncbi:hypothetical protein Purlil1_8587 [Purpureocillium lilacinum]|uniref:RRM domain-containing protein n=1 Tax=Purpureocillium lilacinum TaxID=33203 RepID=A0ABR0BTP8_PURLI|nr:hypothetical protein Purlil1_8587 [Purpureocillium lilacinum]